MLGISSAGASPLDPYNTSLVGRPNNGARNTLTAAGLETPLLASNATATTSFPALYPATPPIGQTATTTVGNYAPPLVPPTTAPDAPADVNSPVTARGINSLGDDLIANLRGTDSASRASAFARPPERPDVDERNDAASLSTRPAPDEFASREPYDASASDATNPGSVTSQAGPSASTAPGDPADIDKDGQVTPIETFRHEQEQASLPSATGRSEGSVSAFDSEQLA